LGDVGGAEWWAGGGGVLFKGRCRPQTGEPLGAFGGSGGGHWAGGSTRSIACQPDVHRGAVADLLGGPLGAGPQARRARTPAGNSRGGKCPQAPQAGAVGRGECIEALGGGVRCALAHTGEVRNGPGGAGNYRVLGGSENGILEKLLLEMRPKVGGAGEAWCGSKSRASRACVSCLQMHPIRNWGQGCKGEEEKRKT
jgi:hypothetical protein